MTDLILIIFSAYLLGSIPTAYLFLHRFHGLDITREGSGNVGALNAYEVTRSRRTGVVVFVIDFLKGAAAILLVGNLWGGESWYLAAAGIAVVAGHNFSIWVRFRGGRGIATAAGVAVFAAPFAMAIWGLGWILTYVISRDIHWGNILASVLVPVTGLFTLLFPPFTIPAGMVHAKTPLLVLIAGICLFILMKHVRPLRELLRHRTVASPAATTDD